MESMAYLTAGNLSVVDVTNSKHGPHAFCYSSGMLDAYEEPDCAVEAAMVKVSARFSFLEDQPFCQ